MNEQSEVATIPAQHTAQSVVGTFRWLREAPERRRVQPRQYGAVSMDLAAFSAWFIGCLDAKISARAPARPRNRSRVGAYRFAALRSSWCPTDAQRAQAIEGMCGWRKLDDDWQNAARRIARAVNTPRLVVREREAPREFRARLRHRFSADD